MHRKSLLPIDFFDFYNRLIVSRIGDDNLKDEVATITNCINKGSVTSGKDQAGGILAYSCRAVMFENCYNHATISSPGRTGGIAGYVRYYYSDYIGCFNYGDVTSTGSTTSAIAAGIAAYGGGGEAYTHQFTFENCGDEGNIEAYHYIGGIVGYLYGASEKTASIKYCYNTGNLTSTNNYVAGLLGYMNGVEDPICQYNYISGTLTAASGKSTYATIYNNDPDPMEPSNLHHNYVAAGTADYYRFKNDLADVAFPSGYRRIYWC